MNQKGNLSFVFFLIVFIISATVIFVVFTPLAQRFTISAYQMSETLVIDSNTAAGGFTDEGMKDEVQGILQQQKDNYVFQIDLLGALNKYSAIIILVLGTISLVLLTRSTVARNTGVV